MSSADLSLPSRHALSPTARGVCAMLIGMALQALNDVVVKLAASNLPVTEIMALRGVMAVAIAFAVIVAMGLGGRLKTLMSPLVMLRSALEAAACFTYFSALAHLGLASFTSIIQATPLIITALVALIGWDRVGWRRWLAVFVGFAGVLLIARPSAEGVNVYAALALASAGLMAVRDLVTSRIPAHAPSMVVTLGSTIAVALTGFVLGGWSAEPWVAPSMPDLVFLAVAAALVVACNMLIVMAFRLGDMSVVGPFRYSVVLAALALGWLVFGERPDAIALAGSALIVGSGLYALKREPARGPAKIAPAAPPA